MLDMRFSNKVEMLFEQLETGNDKSKTKNQDGIENGGATTETIVCRKCHNQIHSGKLKQTVTD